MANFKLCEIKFDDEHVDNKYQIGNGKRRKYPSTSVPNCNDNYLKELIESINELKYLKERQFGLVKPVYENRLSGKRRLKKHKLDEAAPVLSSTVVGGHHGKSEHRSKHDDPNNIKKDKKPVSQSSPASVSKQKYGLRSIKQKEKPKWAVR